MLFLVKKMSDPPYALNLTQIQTITILSTFYSYIFIFIVFAVIYFVFLLSFLFYKSKIVQICVIALNNQYKYLKFYKTRNVFVLKLYSHAVSRNKVLTQKHLWYIFR